MHIADLKSGLCLPKRQLAVLRWLCVAVLLAIFIWRVALPATQHKTYALSVYYTAARLALAGQAGVQFCDEWFFEQQRRLGFGQRADYFCPNPPTNALVLAPVAWLTPDGAAVAWIMVDLAMIGAIVAVGWRLTALGQPLASRADASWFALIAILIIVLFRPLRAELHAVQVYTLLALLYALWLYGYLTRRDWLCGVALALLVLTKFSGWPLWLLMIAVRRWHALAWALGAGIAVGLATLPLLGFEFWRLYLFEQAPAIGANPTHAAPANQTLTSLLRQCFTYDPYWSPHPLVVAPWLVTAIWLLVAAALLAATLIPAYRRAGTIGAAKGVTIDPSALAVLCLVVPLQPAGEEYHYVPLLIVLLLIFSQLWLVLHSPVFVASVALAGILFALPSYFLQTAEWQGWPTALLAYPRLYGALILWGICIARRDTYLVASRTVGGNYG